MAAITTQSAESLGAYLAATPLPFPILRDGGRTVVKAYGVYHMIGFDAFHMARPAVFMIDGAGRIRYLYVAENQQDRPSTELLLAEALTVTNGR